jgi:CheY-like chemotaxis protein
VFKISLYPSRTRVVEDDDSASLALPLGDAACAEVPRVVNPIRGLDAMADAVALIDDLFFQAKVIETAKHLGVSLRVCGTPDALLTAIAQQAPRLIIVDLNARSQPLTAIQRLPDAARAIPLIAFLSHVQTDLAENARAAGCREVMPRSAFTRDLATILARAKSHSS